MISIIKKIFKFFVDILMVAVFAVLLIVIYAKVKMLINHKDYFEVFGYSVFSVATGSMEPAISQNDIILVKNTGDYEINEIITFAKDGEYITHRIVNMTTDMVTTKGDANNAIDVSIPKSDIIGEVVKVYENATVWQKVFTTPSIVIMIFITLILFDFAFSYKGFNKKEVEKKIESKKVVVSKENNVKPEDLSKKEINDISKKMEKIKENIDKDDTIKLTSEEIDKIRQKLDDLKKKENVNLNKKEKDFLNYTIRLDLSELQKGINNNLNKEE